MNEFETSVVQIAYDRLNQAKEHLDRYSLNELKRLFFREKEIELEYNALGNHFFDKSMKAKGKRKEYLNSCFHTFKMFQSMSLNIQDAIKAELGKRGERIP